mmetsp:Transcript_80559/g.222859  ORF Transcript_80559/g.222859 Transcript_80559/m.222859 type:complete len:476 (-) Transcript_80559:63-1490(-)
MPASGRGRRCGGGRAQCLGRQGRRGRPRSLRHECIEYGPECLRADLPGRGHVVHHAEERRHDRLRPLHALRRACDEELRLARLQTRLRPLQDVEIRAGKVLEGVDDLPMVTPQAVDLGSLHWQECRGMANASVIACNHLLHEGLAGLNVFAGSEDLDLDVAFLVTPRSVRHYVALDHTAGLPDLLDGLTVQAQQVAFLPCRDLDDSLLLRTVRLKHAELTAPLHGWSQAALQERGEALLEVLLVVLLASGVPYQCGDQRLQGLHEVALRIALLQAVQLSCNTARNARQGSGHRIRAQDGIELAARGGNEAVDERDCVVHSIGLASNEEPWRVVGALGTVLLDLYVATGHLCHLLHRGALVAHAFADDAWLNVHIRRQVPQLCLVTGADCLEEASAVGYLVGCARHLDGNRGLHLGFLLVMDVEARDTRDFLHLLDRQAFEAEELAELRGGEVVTGWRDYRHGQVHRQDCQVADAR